MQNDVVSTRIDLTTFVELLQYKDRYMYVRKKNDSCITDAFTA